MEKLGLSTCVFDWDAWLRRATATKVSTISAVTASRFLCLVFLCVLRGLFSAIFAVKAFSVARLTNDGLPEQNFQRRIKSETASAAPAPAFPEIFRGILCLPQWFPLRRPWAALLSLKMKQMPKCALLSASEKASQRAGISHRPSSSIDHQKSEIDPPLRNPGVAARYSSSARDGFQRHPSLDTLTGGLPRGCLTEICGPASSGRTTLLLAALAAATRRGEFCVVVDASDALDPQSAAAAGVELERLLWVRCGDDPPKSHASEKASQSTFDFDRSWLAAL